jgi:hypothetical protein
VSDAPDSAEHKNEAPDADKRRGFGLIVPRGGDDADFLARLDYVEMQLARMQLASVTQQATQALGIQAQQMKQSTGHVHPGLLDAIQLTSHMTLSLFYEDVLRVHDMYESDPDSEMLVSVLKNVANGVAESLTILDRKAKLREEERTQGHGGLIQLGKR